MEEETVWGVLILAVAVVIITLTVAISHTTVQSNRAFVEGGYVSCPGSRDGWCKR